MEEKNNDAKILSILILCVAIIGLALGFAAFSTTLSISDEQNSLDDYRSFVIDLSSESSYVDVKPIVPLKSDNSIFATNAFIDNTNNPSITSLKATFLEPGQNVVYSFYSVNKSEYDAYLKSIIYENVAGENFFRVCTAGEGATDSLVQAACDDISIKIEIENFIETNGTVINLSHKLSKKDSEKIKVTIDYAANGDRADGPFSVKFGKVILNYEPVE